jgi:hypothetical protein
MPDEIVAGASASDIGAFFARVAARVAKDSEAPKN